MGGRLHQLLCFLCFLFIQLHLQCCFTLNLEAQRERGSDVESYSHGEMRMRNDGSDTRPCNSSISHCIAGKVQSLAKSGKNSIPLDYAVKHGLNSANSREASVVQKVQHVVQFLHRKLLMVSNNLPAATVTSITPEEANVPSTGSGSFPATRSLYAKSGYGQLDTYLSVGTDGLPSPHSQIEYGEEGSGWTRLVKWVYIIVLPGFALLLIVAAGVALMQQRQQNGALGFWIGASGRMKELPAGVTRYTREELEAACEDFSNIVHNYPDCTLFKGTLSGGVEIGAVSTVASATNWTMRSEMHFREKIETLSKVNHKNFVNLLGYCEESNPFMRIVVFEYVPNGTLYEHLHIKDFDHLDWSARMRVIMGAAYCLQYLHHEVSPPVVLPNLHSNSIFMTDDFAVKIADLSFWKEAVMERHLSRNDYMDPAESSSVDTRTNVYSFGILVLEILSGKLPQSEEYGSILHWATDYLNDPNNIKHLVDPSLKDYKKNELEIICEVIQECIHPDPKDRLEMREITSKLKEVLAVSPEEAKPRLSPLWWAELEILSAEAS